MAARTSAAEAVTRISRALSRKVGGLEFAAPVAFVYNPLEYARAPHELYLARARKGIDALYLGMNPGPLGMAQTGVPFGEIAAVRDFLGISAPVRTPRGRDIMAACGQLKSASERARREKVQLNATA